MKNPKEFPLPLDRDIIEQVPVPKHSFDPQTGKIKTIIQMEQQTVRYMDIPKLKNRCKDGTHIFYPSHPKKWIFSCRNCNFSRKVYPHVYRFVDGALIHKATGKRI